MEPVTTITAALGLAKSASEIGKKLFEVSKELKDHDAKQRVDEILDRLRELKQSASELEDENRELREKLRFKSDGFEFRNPFYYEKSNPQQPFCAKCFAKNIPAPMSEVHHETECTFRRCLVCTNVEVVDRRPSPGYEPWS